MKNFQTPVAALALGALLSSAAIAPQIVAAHGHSARGNEHGKNSKARHVTVKVDGQGYQPANLNLQAGQQVHMTFVSKGNTCANEIRIPSLKKSVDLKSGQKKLVVFTPKKGQTIAFACSMNMFMGKATAR